MVPPTARFMVTRPDAVKSGSKLDSSLRSRRPSAVRSIVREPGQLNSTVRGEVRTFPHEVKLLDVNRPVGKDEANGILIADLYILDLERKCTQVAGQAPLPGLEQRPTQSKRAGDGRMSGELAAEIGAPEGVNIQLVRLKRQVGGIVGAQPHVPLTSNEPCSKWELPVT